MTEPDWLTEGFEKDPTRLRAVAYWMLGSLAEADDLSRKPGCASAVHGPTASTTSMPG